MTRNQTNENGRKTRGKGVQFKPQNLNHHKLFAHNSNFKLCYTRVQDTRICKRLKKLALLIVATEVLDQRLTKSHELLAKQANKMIGSLLICRDQMSLFHYLMQIRMSIIHSIQKCETMTPALYFFHLCYSVNISCVDIIANSKVIFPSVQSYYPLIRLN